MLGRLVSKKKVGKNYKNVGVLRQTKKSANVL